MVLSGQIVVSLDLSEAESLFCAGERLPRLLAQRSNASDIMVMTILCDVDPPRGLRCCRYPETCGHLQRELDRPIQCLNV
jgi:hypothetical protein